MQRRSFITAAACAAFATPPCAAFTMTPPAASATTPRVASATTPRVASATTPRVASATTPRVASATTLRVASATTAGAAQAAPVVLELFTSEGCSSCPPADALLGELARQPAVVALAWHVDYWNGLGWPDPYATRFATDRQRAYAARLRDEVYTPALVVNGAVMVVGSDAAAIAAGVTHAPQPTVPVALRRNAAGVTADIAAPPMPLAALYVAYDVMRVTAVGAGENGGRRLAEYNIVRATQSLRIDAGRAVHIQLPAPDPARGIALLLQSADLLVRGAAHAPPLRDAARLL